MSAIEVVRIPVAGGRLGELAAAVSGARRGYLAQPRCEGVELLGSAMAGELIVIVRWASTEAHDEAAAGPEAGPFFGAVGEFAAGPPSVGFYEEVA